MELLRHEFEPRVRLDDLERARGHRDRVRVARLPHYQGDFALDLSLFRPDPFEHGLALELADGPRVLHDHEIERTVHEHGVVADDPDALTVGHLHHRPGRPRVHGLQDDDLRAPRKHVLELGELVLFVVVAGIEDRLGPEFLRLRDEIGLVLLVSLLLHGLEDESHLQVSRAESGRKQTRDKQRRNQNHHDALHDTLSLPSPDAPSGGRPEGFPEIPDIRFTAFASGGSFPPRARCFYYKTNYQEMSRRKTACRYSPIPPASV